MVRVRFTFIGKQLKGKPFATIDAPRSAWIGLAVPLLRADVI